MIGLQIEDEFENGFQGGILNWCLPSQYKQAKRCHALCYIYDRNCNCWRRNHERTRPRSDSVGQQTSNCVRLSQSLDGNGGGAAPARCPWHSYHGASGAGAAQRESHRNSFAPSAPGRAHRFVRVAIIVAWQMNRLPHTRVSRGSQPVDTPTSTGRACSVKVNAVWSMLPAS